MSHRLVVFSDTHGAREAMRGALPLVRALAPDGLLHLGDVQQDVAFLQTLFPDIPVTGVCGNCDMEPSQPNQRILEVGGARLFMVHGHRQHVKSGLGDLREAALSAGCSIALYGHTHRADIQQEAGLLLVNPGALYGPVGGAATFALLLVEGGKAQGTLMTL